jgi:hypothetical protein
MARIDSVHPIRGSFAGRNVTGTYPRTGVPKRPLCYNPPMNTLKDVLEHAVTWPQEDQDKLAEYAREIEARRTGVYVMSDDERLAVARGLAEADRGEFVPDEVVAEADKRRER